MAALDLPLRWPVDHVAAGYAVRGEVAVAGDVGRVFPLASVTKLLTTMAVLVAVEEGSVALDETPVYVGLDEAAGNDSEVTVRHLLAHTSGLPFEGRRPVSRPGIRRIYSNTGIELAAEHTAAGTGMAFGTYLDEAVLQPLGLATTELGDRSPASGAAATVADVLRLGGEALTPSILSATTLAAATSVQFPGLAGIVPGIGRADPCDWGLGFEIRSNKSPHWTGAANSPATFGHFGGAGTFLWIDPIAGVVCAALTDRPFDAWALEAWPVFADAVLAEAAG